MISIAIVSLLKELEAALDPSCLGIARTAWSQLNIVSGPSNNVLDLIQAIENVVQAVKDRIERQKYTRNFLDKAARFALFTLILEPIFNPPLKLGPGKVHARSGKEPATQRDGSGTGESNAGWRSIQLTSGQLIIDLQALKACLLKMFGGDSTVSIRCVAGLHLAAFLRLT